MPLTQIVNCLFIFFVVLSHLWCIVVICGFGLCRFEDLTVAELQQLHASRKAKPVLFLRGEGWGKWEWRSVVDLTRWLLMLLIPN